jgi:flavin-dependent dehydrogenase
MSSRALPTRIRTVAVLGGGPAGASLAQRLAQQGLVVAIFDRRTRPPLVVGESLIPALMPLLAELGVEDEVRSYSMNKPGATFVLDEGRTVQTLRFADVPGATLSYAYNVPRDRFDETLFQSAIRAGVKLFPFQAGLERDGDDGVKLTAETLAKTDGFFGPDGPDHIVDATGRARTIGKLLQLAFHEGPRKDVAIFAHMDGIPVQDEGHIHTEVMERGWSWRIPLPGRMSLGFVVPQAELNSMGENAEAQYEAMLTRDSCAVRWGAEPRRLTGVVKYNNYQLLTHRGTGPGWSLVGDALGFVDPVFSSGMMLAIESARTLAATIVDGSPAAFQRYEARVRGQIGAWQEAVGYFYNGRLFSAIELGERLEKHFPGSLFAPHFRHHMPRVFTGEATGAWYSLMLLNVMCNYGLMGYDLRKFQVSDGTKLAA